MPIHLKQLLTPDELAQARALLQAGDAPWIDGRRSAGEQALRQKNNLQLAQDSPAATALRALVLAAVQRHALLLSAALPKKKINPLFNRYGEQAIKLPAGDAVLYPGTSVHEVRPVTRGTRLASFFWIESMVRGSEQRRLLFDMDMALLALRQRHGESEEATRLAGTYHNLLLCGPRLGSRSCSAGLPSGPSSAPWAPSATS